MPIYEPLWVFPGMGYKLRTRVNYYAIRFYSIVGSDNHWSPDDFSRWRI
jgi:hypothetical protein